MALTREGFKRETYEEILARTEARAKQHFGEDANTSSRVALGMLLRVWAFLIAWVWQELEHVYYSAYRKYAEGKQLDALMPYSGITRNPATHASGTVQLSGTTGTLVEEGFAVAKSDETIYYTLNDVVIGVNGTALVDVMAVEAGVSGNADIGYINQILNPIDGVMAVTNLSAIINGQDEETDNELRKRADLATEGLGSTTAAAVQAELLKVSGVRSAFVFENDTLSTGLYNTPGKALQPFVLGGLDEDVADAIFKTKAGGIQSYGTTIVEHKDIGGHTHYVGFTRAVQKRIYARITVTTDATFTANYNDVREVLLQYVNALSMGDDVVFAKALANVMKIPGVTDADLTFRTDGTTYIMDNVTIEMNEIAQLNAGDIEVM